MYVYIYIACLEHAFSQVPLCSPQSFRPLLPAVHLQPPPGVEFFRWVTSCRLFRWAHMSEIEAQRRALLAPARAHTNIIKHLSAWSFSFLPSAPACSLCSGFFAFHCSIAPPSRDSSKQGSCMARMRYSDVGWRTEEMAEFVAHVVVFTFSFQGFPGHF